MKITLHILLKDLRRHRWEIALYLISCAAWAWQTIHPGSWQWLHQRELAPIVMFGLWFLITVRVIQGEGLVGDREFWMTRPYHWAQLLAAKALFLLVCLHLPLLIAQVALLIAGGIPITLSLVPGLLYIQFLFFLICTFPAAVLASMSESIVQWLLTVGALGAFALVLSWFPWDRLPVTLSGDENVATVIGGFLIVPLLAFALIWQYVRRRVWLARVALVLAALAVPLTMRIASTEMVRGIAYPEAKAGPLLRLQTASVDSADESRQYMRRDSIYGDSAITLPVAVQSGDSNTMMEIDGVRLTLVGDNAWRWQSKWINRTLKLGHSVSGATIEFQIPKEVADQIQSKHVHVFADLAYNVYRFGPIHKVDTSGEQFSIPGVGVCRWNSFHRNEFEFSGLFCAAPLRLPGAALIGIDSSSYTCPAHAGEAQVAAGHYATSLLDGTDFPAEFDPNPIHSFNLFFENWVPAVPSLHEGNKDLLPSLCRGTPLFVSKGSLVNTERGSFDLGSIGVERLVQGTVDSDE
jgi:hypothetical protein